MMQSFVIVPEALSKPKEGRRVLEVQVAPASDGNSRRAAYVPVEEIMEDPVSRAELINRALSELLGIRRRYKHLQELASVFAEIDSIQASVSVD